MMQNIVPFLFYRGFIMPLHSYLSTTMSLKNKYGPLALVAGASEGLGAAFATYLAAEGMDLVLVARRKQPLDELAQQLQEKYKVKCECISCDLSAPDAAQQLQQHLSGKQVNLLVYNAALYTSRFTCLPLKCCCNCCAASGADRSQEMHSHFTLYFSCNCCANSSSGCFRRATNTRSIPSAARYVAKAAPRPSDAPATSASGPYLFFSDIVVLR